MVATGSLLIQVNTLMQPLNIQVGRLRRLGNRLIVDRQVIHHILAPTWAIHAINTLQQQVRNLIGERRVVRHHRRVGGGQQR